MKLLVIGDVHDQIEQVDKLLYNIEKNYDYVIFLGDFFDSFKKENSRLRTEDTANWLKEHLSDSNKIFLYGNHDLHYRFYSNSYIRGSGYTVSKYCTINDILDREDWLNFKVFYEADGFLFSHAGVNETLLHPILGFNSIAFQKECDIALDSLGTNSTSFIFEPGIARGGLLKYGGITWQDWYEEFTPISGLNQIVGHTHGEKIRFKTIESSINCNIDCFPNFVIEVDNGIINEIKLEF